MDTSITRRDRIAEEGDELYAELYSAEIARQKADYEAEFGPEYRTARPFQPNGVQAHLTAIYKIAADPVHGPFGIDVAKAPVPQRRYAADVACVSFDGSECRVVFAIKALFGDDLESALVVRMSPIAVKQFSESMDVMSDPTLAELLSMYKIKPEPLIVVSSKPSHVANVVANLVAVAVAGFETCVDFYHASAFAMRKSASQTKLEVDPIVRVDIKTALFYSLINAIDDISRNLDLGDLQEQKNV